MKRSFVGATSTLACAVALAAAVSCSSQPTAPSSSSTPAPTVGQDSDAGPTGTGVTSASGDPFAPQPDESEGLTNVSADLDALLEHGALAGACDRYRAGQTDRKTKLTCGKWMYFYETFGTAGMPTALVKFLAQSFPNELGVGFTKLGMVLDPASADKLPLGLAPTAKMNGTIDAVAFTCASCHFGRLRDGRYAVGAPNHAYDYAAHILTITLAPTVGMGLSSAGDHSPAALAKVQPVLDKLSSDFTLKAQFGMAIAPLASLKLPGMTKEVESQYAAWPRGAMDFVIAPLPVDDHVDVVGKILALWGIPRDQEASSAGMANALLAWTGVAHSLNEFLGGFAVLGGVTPPTQEALEPLADYIYSLRAPENPAPPDRALAARGAKLFGDKGCASCHDGPRGSGKRAYTFAEIGTDDVLAKWIDPNLSGQACCGVSVQPGQLTHGVKSPRMVGMWALDRFLHNGTLSSLEQLFCLEPRPGGIAPLRADGHAFTCDNLSDDDKRALVAYLLSH